MKKIFTSNSKIKYSLLSILFSILFIFTALNISNPITVYADDDTPQIGQVLNLSEFSANEYDESSNERAGYLYWAASGDRSGIYYYVIDDKGNARAQGIIMDDAGRAQYGIDYGSKCTSGKIIASPKIHVSASTLGMPSVDYQPNVSPVFYSGGWQSKGSESMAYLTEIVSEITIKGCRMPCPRWARLVAIQSGGEVLESLAEPGTKWTVFVEPVSVGYMYTDETFSKKTANTVHKKAEFEAGSPKPMGTMNADGSFTPKVYGNTAQLLLEKSVAIGDSGQYRYKFYETQLPFSLCLDHDAQFCQYVGNGYTGFTAVNACNKPVQRISHIEQNEGIAIAALDITGISLPPIHTFGGATPGDTENPAPPKNGNCTIKKLYYTQIIASDGTILTEATDYHPYTRTLTTNYISIDNEEGYEIEGWKTSTSDRAFTQKSHYDGISPVKQSGTSSQEITRNP